MRRPNGFTIIELLVSIAIIGILVSVLLPSLEGARDETRLAMCGSNVRQIIIAASAFATDAKGFYPGYKPPGDPTAMRARSWQKAPEEMAPYCGGSVDRRENPLWSCPEASRVSLNDPLGNRANYSLFCNITENLYSGVTVGGTPYYVPNNPNEAMQHIDRSLIFRSPGFAGGGGWESNILVSDIAQRAGYNGNVQSGHMKGRKGATWATTGGAGGYGALGWWSNDAVCTANFGFQDGHVERHKFTKIGLFSVMAVGVDSPVNWDSFLLPKASIRRYP